MKRTILAVAALACAAAQAAEIKVLSSNALKPVLEELVPQFEKATGHRVKAEFAPAADLKGRIEKREAFDVASPRR
jgi:molybdate transport system substrate-binding protein